MAKPRDKKNISKTAAIRAELKKTPSPKEVAKRLNSRGIKVSPQYVSTIKANDKKRVQGTGTTSIRASNGHQTNIDLQQANELMLKAVDLVIEAGPKQARQLIGVAEKIVERTNQ